MPSGPYTHSQLRERGIMPDTQVWVEERGAWIAAGDISGFSDIFLAHDSGQTETAEGVAEAESPEQIPAESHQVAVTESPKPQVPTRKLLTLIFATVVIDIIIIIAGLVLLNIADTRTIIEY